MTILKISRNPTLASEYRTAIRVTFAGVGSAPSTTLERPGKFGRFLIDWAITTLESENPTKVRVGGDSLQT
jgi:hypothetical protein